MIQNPQNPLRLFCARSRSLRLRSVLAFAAVLSLAASLLSGAPVHPPSEAADSAIVFSGVMSAHGRTLVALSDRTSAVSRWVAPGDEFAGYHLSAYDGTNEVVTLVRQQQVLRLSLKKPHVQTAIAPEIAGMTRDRQLMIWARVRELDGDNLVSALVASGNAELKVLVDAHQQLVREATTHQQALARLSPGANDGAEINQLRQAYATSVQQEIKAYGRLQQEAVMIKQVLQQRINQ